MHTPGPEQDDGFDFLFKIILIGDSNVGKTCVVQNFKSGFFWDKQQNTIGVDFSVRTVEIEGKRVKVSDERSLRIQEISLIIHTGWIHVDYAFVQLRLLQIMLPKQFNFT